MKILVRLPQRLHQPRIHPDYKPLAPYMADSEVGMFRAWGVWSGQGNERLRIDGEHFHTELRKLERGGGGGVASGV